MPVYIVESVITRGGVSLVLDFFDQGGQRKLVLLPAQAVEARRQRYQIDTIEEPEEAFSSIRTRENTMGNSVFLTRVNDGVRSIHLQQRIADPNDETQLWHFHPVGQFTLIAFGKYKFAPMGLLPEAQRPLQLLTAVEDATVPGQTHRIRVRQQQSTLEEGQLWFLRQV